MATEIDLAYAAGIIDGEGCITIGCNSQKAKPSYCLLVEIGMCDPEIPTWMHRTFGGSFAKYLTKRVEHKDVYYWGLYAGNAQRFLELIISHLKLKANRAELAIEFQGLKKPYGTYGPGKFKSLVLQEAEEILVNKLRKLNQRGVIVKKEKIRKDVTIEVPVARIEIKAK